MITLTDVTKTFDGFKALDELNMHVPKGSIYGLVGPNGAGKSTVLRHITGAYKPDQGTVLIDGQPVFENPAVKSRFAFIPDEIFYYNGSNLNDLKKLYKGLYKTFDEGLFERLFECFPEVNRHRNVRSFSKGMQKQAAFMLSLSVRPELLILDEPVDGLDPVIRRQVWNLILADVAERDMTVLVSSHNLRELEDVCDHVGIMNKGHIMLERSLTELQGSVSKYQIAFRGELPELPAGLDVLHVDSIGRIKTLIIRGDSEEITAQLESLEPAILDVLPLTLEEIFIYEMGGADYAVKDILL